MNRKIGRSSNSFHKIQYQRTATGSNYRITLTEKTANIFCGCKFKEIITENGIFLVKSGAELNRFEKKLVGDS